MNYWCYTIQKNQFLKEQILLFSLQEILLTPIERIEEYVYLLTALLTHTAMDHSDRPDLLQAINSFKEVNSLIQKVRRIYI